MPSNFLQHPTVNVLRCPAKSLEFLRKGVVYAKFDNLFHLEQISEESALILVVDQIVLVLLFCFLLFRGVTRATIII